MNEIKPVFSDDQHANAEEVLRSLARLLGRQAAREFAEAEQIMKGTALLYVYTKQGAYEKALSIVDRLLYADQPPLHV